MKGSSVKNIKFDPDKQKIVSCVVCKQPMVVGKFAKVGQKCHGCQNIPKGSRDHKEPEVRKIKADPNSFAVKFVEMVTKLGFDATDKRLWRKKYGIDNGGIATVYVMVENNIAGHEPHLGYFSLIIQRAIGLDEDFRKFMPADAASDCELLASEFGAVEVRRPQIGQERCAICGELTYEFGVDTKNNRILCAKKCFKKMFTSRGAESES